MLLSELIVYILQGVYVLYAVLEMIFKYKIRQSLLF